MARWCQRDHRRPHLRGCAPAGLDAWSSYAKAPELVGIDGIALAGDGKIYINNVRQQLFQRVERKTDGSYDRLTNLTVSSPLAGPDGLRSLGGNRFIQGEGQGGRVALVDVNGDTATITAGRHGPQRSGRGHRGRRTPPISLKARSIIWSTRRMRDRIARSVRDPGAARVPRN